jgi:hypothetical protein
MLATLRFLAASKWFACCTEPRTWTRSSGIRIKRCREVGWSSCSAIWGLKVESPNRAAGAARHTIFDFRSSLARMNGSTPGPWVPKSLSPRVR